MTMRKLVLLLVISIVAFSGCMKDKTCVAKTVASEDAAMQSFITTNGINATRHSSGMYFEITNPGSGPSPNFNTVNSVRYTGKLMNGTIFDSRTTTPINFNLASVIPGWQLALPMIQKGGTMKLVIPSSLAYGCQAVGTVPANSILYFEIELVDVV